MFCVGCVQALRGVQVTWMIQAANGTAWSNSSNQSAGTFARHHGWVLNGPCHPCARVPCFENRIRMFPYVPTGFAQSAGGYFVCSMICSILRFHMFQRITDTHTHARHTCTHMRACAGKPRAFDEIQAWNEFWRGFILQTLALCSFNTSGHGDSSSSSADLADGSLSSD